MFPVFVKSYSVVLTVSNVKVELHGDQQIKVAEWDGGTPLTLSRTTAS